MLEKIIDESRSVRHKRDQFYLSYRQEQTERKSPKRSQIILQRVLVNREARPSPKHRNFGIFKTLDNSMLSKFIK